MSPLESPLFEERSIHVVCPSDLNLDSILVSVVYGYVWAGFCSGQSTVRQNTAREKVQLIVPVITFLSVRLLCLAPDLLLYGAVSSAAAAARPLCSVFIDFQVHSEFAIVLPRPTVL